MFCLLVAVRFHDGRYHGQPDWPPSPARLFQALLAGVGGGDPLKDEFEKAFAWMETLDPPTIAVPPSRPGQNFNNYVPNNDLDSVRGDPRRIGKIRTPKIIRPIMFDGPLLYIWPFGETTDAKVHAPRLVSITEELYQFGRGIDMAWACGEIVSADEADARLRAHEGPVYRPGRESGGIALAVPAPGSLKSLIERHHAMRTRFRTRFEKSPTKKEPDRQVPKGQLFVQPPKPRFRQIIYDSPPKWLLFDLTGPVTPWNFQRIVALTERVREEAHKRLAGAFPAKASTIRNVIVGHRDATEADKAARIRITPLPSIGHHYADRAIRRVLVEIPPDCPLPTGDLAWAFTVTLLQSDDGEVTCELTQAEERGMLAHYGIENAEPALEWRSVTPAALPRPVARRRLDPGSERAAEEGRAKAAAIQALRHAGLRASPTEVLVQREPFDAKGSRAEAFAPGTRFAKEQLWHVSLTFAEPVQGPIVLGDGRYLGLGIMAPLRDRWQDVMAFSLPADMRPVSREAPGLLHATRRALMALARDQAEDGRVPQLFSGHEPDGAPAASGQHRHVFLACTDSDRDGRIDQLIVAAPWACDRSIRPRREERATFDRVARSLRLVRASALGAIPLLAASTRSRLTDPAAVWQSETPYRPTRHGKAGDDPEAFLHQDVAAECARRALPRPQIETLALVPGPKGGIAACLRLHFAVAVAGPLLLGRDSHRGGGLFLAAK